MKNYKAVSLKFLSVIKVALYYLEPQGNCLELRDIDNIAIFKKRYE